MPVANNDVLRRLRYTFDFSDAKMIAIFGAAECAVTRAEISDLLKREDDPAFVECTDRQLATFLNGLIVEFRGKREGPPPIPEDRLNYNIMLRKLKIALNLQSEGMLAILSLAHVTISKHELSAFFRKPFHAQYRECKAQIFRKFLAGMQRKYRKADSGE
jgi:uncharacterized protein YehS (DUF1456 family)